MEYSKNAEFILAGSKNGLVMARIIGGRLVVYRVYPIERSWP